MAESPSKLVARVPKARGQQVEAVLMRRRRFLEKRGSLKS